MEGVPTWIANPERQQHNINRASQIVDQAQHLHRMICVAPFHSYRDLAIRNPMTILRELLDDLEQSLKKEGG